jgi:hypothetical protein
MPTVLRSLAHAGCFGVQQGCADHELRGIESVIAEHLEELLNGWNSIHIR